MARQDAANMTKAFNKALALAGVILTKVDGDTRGAALSICSITGKPIKFIGVGDRAIYPKIVSRILGMEDVISIIESNLSKDDKK